jgi:hypothetical protein
MILKVAEKCIADDFRYKPGLTAPDFITLRLDFQAGKGMKLDLD